MLIMKYVELKQAFAICFEFQLNLVLFINVLIHVLTVFFRTKNCLIFYKFTAVSSFMRISFGKTSKSLRRHGDSLFSPGMAFVRASYSYSFLTFD